MHKACRLLGSGLLLWAGSISLASATTYHVNSLVDEADTNTADDVCSTASGACSLRAAIQQANASAGADVILLASGVYNFSLAGDAEDMGLTGDLDVRSEIIITGNGADQSVIDAMRLDRVLEVHGAGQLTLNDVTVRNGLVQFGANSGGAGIGVSGGQLTVNDSNITLNYAYAMGGGISNFNGTVTLNRTVVDQNKSDAQGAGIFNQDGNLTINDTLISANGGARWLGGGIYNSAVSHLLEINNSTITGHTVQGDGAGILHLLGSLKITNSTISRNGASRNGGGLFIRNGNSRAGVVHELRNVTVAYNSAVRNGAGIFLEGNILLNTSNSIIAESTRGQDCYMASPSAELGSLGYNLDSDGSCNLISIVGSISGGVADLEALADNDGVTPTHALGVNSEALGAGANCLAFDQRGYARPASGCDIGAYESGASAPQVAISAPPANQGASTDGANSVPIAFNQSLVVNAGGVVSSVFGAVDNDGDPLSYQLVQAPTKGNFGLATDYLANDFDYAASANATGTDSFSFIACDQHDACSAPAIISITIGSEPISGEMVVELAEGSLGEVSPVSVVAPSNLDVTASDPDYTQPLGVFYFDVHDIPAEANAAGGTVVVIQLPPDADISPDAEIRKVNRWGVWMPLSSTPSPTVSSGVIDRVNKTLTLTLIDGDDFDHNPLPGEIRDPVAIAVDKSVDPSMQSLQATVVNDEPVAVYSGDELTAVTFSDTSAGASGGSSALNPAMLALFGLLMLVRRRSR